MGVALLHRDSATERQRRGALLTQLREMIFAKRFLPSELPAVEAWLGREMAATGNYDDALPMIRNAVDAFFGAGRWGYLCDPPPV